MNIAAEASPITRLSPARSALALTLLLASLATGAQEPAQPPTEAEPAQTEQPADATTPEAAQADAGQPAATESEDPFDYEASEQISEDLSVSFPVDI